MYDSCIIMLETTPILFYIIQCCAMSSYSFNTSNLSLHVPQVCACMCAHDGSRPYTPSLEFTFMSSNLCPYLRAMARACHQYTHLASPNEKKRKRGPTQVHTSTVTTVDSAFHKVEGSIN
jgi:acetyl-CoA carboxylase carboxyltransferase component